MEKNDKMEKRIELLYSYLINRRSYLSDDVHTLQQNLRYRDFSSVDCLELIIALERLHLFEEVSHDIFHLLSIRRGQPP